MSEETNTSGAPNPRDYSVTLTTLTDAQLLEESEKNQWLMGHIQMSPVDYKARYLACRSEIHIRLQIKTMLDKQCQGVLDLEHDSLNNTP